MGIQEFGNTIKSNLEKIGNNYAENFKEHTVIGRMVNNGDSLFEAIKNDLSEDTTLGRMITKGESFTEAFKEASKNSLGARSLVFGAGTENAIDALLAASDEVEAGEAIAKPADEE